MKKLVSMLLAAAMLLVSGLAFAQENDAAWRAQQNAAQGCYVENLTEDEFAALTETTIIKDPNSITGYTVTFRHYAPDATRVRIRGEWSLYSSTNNCKFIRGSYTPEEWTDGMFPLQADMKDWPAFDMIKNEETGVWSYTVPMPSGTWSYRFYEGGVEGAALTDYTDAVATTDVNNRPWEKELGEQGNSQVRVPFDADKQTNDFSVQLPQPEGKFGAVEVLTYKAENLTETKDDPAVAVYLPYGYDAERAEPYKTLYISHGGGLESETSWYNKGSLANIADNLMASGAVEPAVIVILNNYAVDFDLTSFINEVVPMIEEKYNVSSAVADKAVCGLSRGGMFTTQLMLQYPSAFGTFGVFSGAFADPTTEIEYPQELKNANFYMAAGYYDMAYNDLVNACRLLTEQGIAFNSNFLDGGHDWNLWRQLAVDFMSNYLWK